jgi:excisionase family DNA binding protein
MSPKPRAEQLADQLSELLKSVGDTRLLYSIPETAEKLDVSPNTVYKLIADGDLRAVDMASSTAKRSRTRVRADDIEAFIEARTRQPRAS